MQPGEDAALQRQTQRAAAPPDQTAADETFDAVERRRRIAAGPACDASQRREIASLNRDTKIHRKCPMMICLESP
jgi:hypothetical protein